MQLPPPAPADSVPATQVAALCWRLRKDQVEVLLITSRDTGRWVIPKGWPMSGLSDAAAAAREAWEEAGVEGQTGSTPLGQYLYDKITRPSNALRCAVEVFALQVEALRNRFPERKQRRRKWFGAAEAALLVAEPDLRQLLDLIDQRPDVLTAPRA